MKSAINLRSKGFRRTLLAGSLAVTLAAAGGVAFITRWHEITEAPAVAFSTEEYQPPLSTLTAPIEISLVSLAGALNEKAPDRFVHQWKDSVRFEESTGIPKITCDWLKCHKTGYNTVKIDVPYQGDASVTRQGPIVLVGHGDELEVRMPVSFWVRIAGRGSLGARVHETAEGRFVLSTRIHATVREDWTLSFAASPAIEWNGAPGGKLFNLVPYTIRSLVEDKLNDGMKDLVADLEKQANEQLALHASASQVWTSAFVAYKIPGDMPTWAVVTPQEVAWSPLSFDNDTVHAALKLSLHTAVIVGGEAPTAPAATALPALTTISKPSAGEVTLNAPLRVSYESLSALALQMAGTLPSLSKAGITIKDIDFYPAGKRLAVRVEAQVDIAGQWLDTRTVIHLAGTPTIDPVTQKVSLEHLTLKRTLDNALVDVLEVPLHDLIEKAIAQKLKTDVGPLIADANLRISGSLAPLADKGAMVNVTIGSVGLGQTHLMKDAFVVPVQIVGSVSSELDAARIATR